MTAQSLSLRASQHFVAASHFWPVLPTPSPSSSLCSYRLPRKVVESPFLELFKNDVDWQSRTWFSGEHGGGVGLVIVIGDFEGLFQP